MRVNTQQAEPTCSTVGKRGKILRSGSQTPLQLQTSFDRPEDQPIDDVANGYDKNHDGDYLAHVIQVAPHHEQLSQTEADEDHLAGNQRAPGESPALFQSGDDIGQAGRQQHVPEEATPPGTKVASRHAVDLWHLLTPGF